MRLPPNIKRGQVRRTAGVVTPDEWKALTDDERDAADALAAHVWWRCRQAEHPALEGQDGIFLTVRHAQRLLRAVGARKTGEKAAAAAIAAMVDHGWIEDTGQVKKPRRSAPSVARAEQFQDGPVAPEGGKEAQPTPARSYWWRVYRVPAITQVVDATKVRAYTTFQAVPQRLASLSALLKRQGLVSGPRTRTRPKRGSVQWVFLHSGPP